MTLLTLKPISVGFGNRDIIDAQRNLPRIKEEWYPTVLVLHRFMVAVAWRPRTRMVQMVRWWIRWFGTEVPSQGSEGRHQACVDLAGMLGSPGFWDSPWTTVDSGPITDADIGAWSFSILMLVKFTAFLPFAGQKG